jgi:hypothetical protein
VVALRYPSESGGWQLGDIDLSEHLGKYRDHEVVVVIASVGKAGEVEKEKYVCGICGFALTELGECPRCKMQIERTARGLRKRRQRDELFKEIDEIVDDEWDGRGQEPHQSSQGMVSWELFLGCPPLLGHFSFVSCSWNAPEPESALIPDKGAQ